MKILLTNDDGILSAGIRCIARDLETEGLLFATLAPDRERSGVGHAMTITRPVAAHRVALGSFPTKAPAMACDGTPTDCVVLATEHFFKEADFVVSGINQGANLGDDITYSGTACAALEGVIADKGAMAVSLCMRSTDEHIHNETASSVALTILNWVIETPLPKGLMLNVNVPNIALHNLKGIQITHQGKRRYRDKLRPVHDPHGRDLFWIGGRIEDCLSEGSDVLAVTQGYASLTPIQLELTDYPCLKSFRNNTLGDHLSARLLG